MRPNTFVTFFLPAAARGNPMHPRYTEFYFVANACVFGVLLSLVGAGVMAYVGLAPWGFGLSAALGLGTLLALRRWGHYRLPLALASVAGLFICYGFIRDTGMLFSINVNLLHLYLLLALLADKKWGGWSVPVCLAVLVFLYGHTPPAGPGLPGNPGYALALHGFVTVFLGGAVAYGRYSENRQQLEIQRLQRQRISLLDEAVQQRTAQLQTLRQALAADFHDETGNVLAAITRQASELEWQLPDRPEVLPLVRGIIDNSNQLYAASKDFLWDLTHQSDQPEALFHYLAAHGQRYYNQFDVAFSAELTAAPDPRGQLPPLASLNLLYLFKEAMANVVKHAGATEVLLTLTPTAGHVTYALQDNGRWTEPRPDTPHYGLQNMRARSRKNNFALTVAGTAHGTRVSLTVPVHTAFVS
jgi:signal transduction histidine kinase